MDVRNKLLSLVVTLACICGFDQNRMQSQAPKPADSSAANAANITGVWRGEMNGLPGVTLVVTDEGGSLSGAVLFYFQVRKTVNDPYTSTPGLPEPMFQMHFDGTTLTFQVSHRRAHPPRTLSDPPVSFSLTLTAPNQAALVNESEKGPGLVLTRSEY
ncbi:MAG: hypothetical protein ABSB50_15625 [Terracidiphilus sp.]|jgi:hypothetical protein